MHVGALAVYPLKSAGQVLLQAMRLDRFGPAGDRRWMLVDAAGRFVTQRTHPRMCLLSVQESDTGLWLHAPGCPAFHVARPEDGIEVRVQVWDDWVPARRAGDRADAWCSSFLGMPVRLVWMPESTCREVSPAHAGPGHTTGFSDGFPILLATQSSLDYLNERLDIAVDWRRFRPNIVVAGDVAPHAEDQWRRLRIGEVELAVVKPCSRCVIPSINPDTADKNSQILTVMRGYRTAADGKTCFGQNVIVVSRPEGAVIRTGDAVEVLD